MIGQHALWAYTDKADFKELEKYGADSISIALTADILNELKIETALNTKKLTSDVLPDEEIQVSKLIFYGTAVLIFLLLTTTIYLIFIKLRSAELNDL